MSDAPARPPVDPPARAPVLSLHRGPAGQTGVRVRATRELAQRILVGTYPQERPVPTEAELVADLGVSRTVLREAVRTLAAKGLLETRQRAGTIVLPRARWHLLDPDVLSWMGGIEPDGAFLLDLTTARRVIEPAAAALAATVCNAQDLAAIERAWQRMRAAALDDPDACIAADLEFHQGILRASGNAVFANLGEAVGAALLGAFRLTTEASENFAATLAVHGDVLEALRLRDADRARAAMERLLGVASADLLRALDGSPGTTNGSAPDGDRRRPGPRR